MRNEDLGYKIRLCDDRTQISVAMSTFVEETQVSIIYEENTIFGDFEYELLINLYINNNVCHVISRDLWAIHL